MLPSDIADTLVDLIATETQGLDTIGTRIVANRIYEVIRPWLHPSRQGMSPAIEPMTDEESRRFEHTFIPFGKYATSPIENVPVAYLEWLADQSRNTWRNLHRYLNSPRIRAEREKED
jgi:hypothetical protein